MQNEQVTQIENTLDQMNEPLSPLKDFILPGGTQAGRVVSSGSQRLPSRRETIASSSGTAVGVQSINQVLESVVGSVVCHGETPKPKGTEFPMFFGKNLSIPSEERWGSTILHPWSTHSWARLDPYFSTHLSHLRRAQQKPDWPRFPTSPIELTYQKHSPAGTRSK